MFRFGPFRLAPFVTARRQRFEAAVASEVEYLRAVYGEDALARGIERASRAYISDGRRSVITEAVRRLAVAAATEESSEAPEAPKP